MKTERVSLQQEIFSQDPLECFDRDLQVFLPVFLLTSKSSCSFGTLPTVRCSNENAARENYGSLTGVLNHRLAPPPPFETCQTICPRTQKCHRNFCSGISRSKRGVPGDAMV